MKIKKNNSIRALEKAIELDPNRTFYYEDYFNNFHKIKPEKSIIFIKKAIHLNPNKKSLYQDLAVFLKEKGDHEEATKITELIQNFPEHSLDLVSYIDEFSVQPLG